jgi:four helix bundle protein
MRDHRKLEAFTLADTLPLRIYSITKAFPEEERYGLISQLRRAAVSIGANIVEGSARSSQADYLRFLTISYSSACELEYELSLARRLGYIEPHVAREMAVLASRTCRVLRGLVNAFSQGEGAVGCWRPVGGGDAGLLAIEEAFRYLSALILASSPEPSTQ